MAALFPTREPMSSQDVIRAWTLQRLLGFLTSLTGSGPSLATVGTEEAAPADVLQEQCVFLVLGGWGP